MKEGDYCLIEFTYMKRKFSGYFKGYGTVKEMDKGHILFVDNDNFPYLVQRAKVIRFEPQPEPAITKM